MYVIYVQWQTLAIWGGFLLYTILLLLQLCRLAILQLQQQQLIVVVEVVTREPPETELVFPHSFSQYQHQN